MVVDWLKNLIWYLIRWGTPVPETGMSRLAEYAQLKKLLDELAINCVVDVGANQGQTVQLLRGLGFTGHVYSFEPQQQMFERMQKHHKHDPKWQGFQIALGASSAQIPLHVNLASNEMSSLLSLHNSDMETKPEIVQMSTLDELLPTLIKPIAEPRILLKMDTEGYDLEVFKGATAVLPHIYALQSEVFVHNTYAHAPHYLESLQVYETAGFELVNLAFISRTEADELMCLNALMKRVMDRGR